MPRRRGQPPAPPPSGAPGAAEPPEHHGGHAGAAIDPHPASPSAAQASGTAEEMSASSHVAQFANALTLRRLMLVLAFAGIADPDKFFATLEAHGIPAVVRKPFPDHHRYAADELAALAASARRDGLTLVTTEKDMMRMSGDPAAFDLIRQASVLPVTLTFRDTPAVQAMLLDAVRSQRSPMRC